MSIVHLRTREQLHEVLANQPVWIDYMQMPDGSRILLFEVEEDRFVILRQTGKPSCPHLLTFTFRKLPFHLTNYFYKFS